LPKDPFDVVLRGELAGDGYSGAAPLYSIRGLED
jgi:hypothetical protein